LQGLEVEWFFSFMPRNKDALAPVSSSSRLIFATVFFPFFGMAWQERLPSALAYLAEIEQFEISANF